MTAAASDASLRRRAATSAIAVVIALCIGGGAKAEDIGAEITVRGPESSAAKFDADGSILAKLRIPLPDRRLFQPLVNQAAKANGLPPTYLDKVLWRESQYFTLAQSPAGAQGMAQFMPSTASDRRLEDPYDPRAAILAAAAYLSELRRQFGGSLDLAAAAYNAGPRVVREWQEGRRGLPRETIDYVRFVTGADLAPEGPAPAVNIFAIDKLLPSAARSLDKRKLSPEAALCAALSTPERPCRVLDSY